MPIIQTNSGYGYVYKTNTKPKKSLPKFFKILLFLCLVSFTIFAGFFLSRLIPNIAGINTNLIVTNRQVYAISGGEFEDYNTALVFSETIKKQGGAGFVFKTNDMFNVLLSAYPKKQDALTVIENLSQEGVDTFLLTLNYQSLSMNLECDSSEKKIIKNACNSFFDCYDGLYSLSLDYDKNSYSKGEILNQIEQLKASVEKNKQLLKTSNQNVSQASLVYLKLYLDEMVGTLENLLDCKENFNAQIKYSYFKCLQIYSDFCQEIGK